MHKTWGLCRYSKVPFKVNWFSQYSSDKTSTNFSLAFPKNGSSWSWKHSSEQNPHPESDLISNCGCVINWEKLLNVAQFQNLTKINKNALKMGKYEHENETQMDKQ